MKIFKEIGAFIAEDGAKFFSLAEAKSHEELSYVGKTLSTFGHAEVTAALNKVEKVYPEVRDAISYLVAHLTYQQAAAIIGKDVQRIESYLAPEAVRAPDTPLPDDAAQTSVPPVNPKATAAGQDQEPPAPSSEPERVQKPDTRPRPSDPQPVPASDAGPAAAPATFDDAPADRVPLTRSDLDDAVPPYVPPASGGADPITAMKGIASVEEQKAAANG